MAANDFPEIAMQASKETSAAYLNSVLFTTACLRARVFANVACQLVMKTMYTRYPVKLKPIHPVYKTYKRKSGLLNIAMKKYFVCLIFVPPCLRQKILMANFSQTTVHH